MSDSRIVVADEEQLDLRYYLSFARTVWFKYYKLVIALNILGIAAAFFYVQSLAPAYTASVTLHVAPRDNTVFNLEQIYWGGGTDPSFRFTQIGIILSAQLMREVAAEMELHKQGELNPARVRTGFIGYLKNRFFPAESYSDLPDEVALELAAANLAGLIGIEDGDSDGFSNLMGVSVTMVDPELAAGTANAIGQAYIDSVLRNELDNTLKNQQFLTERLAVLRVQLQTAEQRLRDFLESENIVARPSGRTETETELDALRARYFDARQERVRLDNLISQVRNIQRGGTEISSVPAIASHPLVGRISGEILQLEQRKNELSERYGSRHNRMIALESELEGARQALAEQIASVLQGIESDLKIARRTESVAEESLEGARSKVQAIGRKDYKISELQQDIDVKRAVYTLFLEKLNRDDASGPIRNNNIWIADPATVPRKGNKPSLFLATLLAMIGSTVIGLGVGVTRVALDNTLETEEEVVEKTGAPLLGLLPIVPGSEVNSSLLFKEYLENLHSRFSESIRSVRTTMTLLNVRGDYRRLLVTSCNEHEGKTSVAMTLAASLGQTASVVLLDADLRRPSIEKSMLQENLHRLGLSDAISGGSRWQDCVIRHEASGIDVLVAGSRSLRPLELLGSSSFTTMLNELAEHYDYIVIDSPPCTAVSDSYLLSSVVDTVLFVVKSGSTHVTQIRGVLNRFRELDANIAGILLNRVDFDAKYHPYYKSYSNYEGYGAEPDPVQINQAS